MAAAVLSAITPAAYCNRLEQFPRKNLLGISQSGGLTPTAAETALGITAGSIADQALALYLDGYVEFTLTMAADTNTAGVVNLTDTLGVDFLTTSCSRRIDVEVFVKADVDAGLVKEELLVACAATPIVYRLLQGFTADGAAAANARAAGAGDWSVALLGASTVLSQSSNDIILTLLGITDINTTWFVKIKVYPKVAHALVPTT